MRALLITTIALIGPLGGCKEQNPAFCPAHPEDPRCGGMGADGGIDSDNSTIDAPPDAVACIGTGAFEVCAMSAATGMKTLTGTLDTTTSTLCSATQYWKTAGNTESCF